MKLLAETHTHTHASTHAYSSCLEMVRAVREHGGELLSVTDHGPALHDSPHSWHFATRSLPNKIDGIYVLGGAEVNIIDYKGRIDLPDYLLKKCAPVIASIHRPVLPTCGDREKVTQTYINVMNNPCVDILGHCGYPDYEFDIDAVLSEIKRLDKIVEINSHTFAVRKDSIKNCIKIAKRCFELGVKMVISTDAHSAYDIGATAAAEQTLSELGIGEELIMNTSAEKFLKHLHNCGRDVRGIYEEEFICSQKALKKNL